MKSTSNFVARQLDGFRLQCWQELPESDCEALLAAAGELPQSPMSADRRLGKVVLPASSEAPFSEAFVKTYGAVDHQKESLLGRLPVTRLLPRYAVREGSAYQRLAEAGVRTPQLLMFGEQWRSGLRGSGIVAVEYIDAPLLAEVAAQSSGSCWRLKAIDFIALMHQSGLCHGDANFSNFLLVNGELVVIDVETSRPVNTKQRFSDLVNCIKGGLLTSIETRHLVPPGQRADRSADAAVIDEMLDRYQKSGLPLPGSEAKIRLRIDEKVNSTRERRGAHHLG